MKAKQTVISIDSANTENSWSIPDSTYRIKIQARDPASNEVRVYFDSSSNDFATTDNGDNKFWTIPGNSTETFEGSFGEGSQNTMFLQSPDGATKVEIHYHQNT